MGLCWLDEEHAIMEWMLVGFPTEYSLNSITSGLFFSPNLFALSSLVPHTLSRLQPSSLVMSFKPSLDLLPTLPVPLQPLDRKYPEDEHFDLVTALFPVLSTVADTEYYMFVE